VVAVVLDPSAAARLHRETGWRAAAALRMTAARDTISFNRRSS